MALILVEPSYCFGLGSDDHCRGLALALGLALPSWS